MRLTVKRQQGAVNPQYDEKYYKSQLWRVNWRQHGYPYCGIYCISPDNKWPTKIGISQNPVKRLIQLQNSHWRKLDVFEYRYCADFNAARKVEQKAHQLCRDNGQLLFGEWFDLRPDKAMEVISFAACAVGVELNTKIPSEEIHKAMRSSTESFQSRNGGTVI